MPKFMGGPIFMNSGGQGPDDYLLKPVVGGHWVKVIFRFGRNFGVTIEDGRIVKPKEPIRPGTPASLASQLVAAEDRRAMDRIFPVEQVCVPDNARRAAKLANSNRLVTMAAYDFIQKYG